LTLTSALERKIDDGVPSDAVYLIIVIAIINMAGLVRKCRAA